MLVASERFELRLSPQDRTRLDALSAQAGKSRAKVLKMLLRSTGESPGKPADSGERAIVSEANALPLSDQSN